MLAEFDPYVWDFRIFLAALVAMLGIYVWNGRRMRARARACLAHFPTNIPNVTITFWSADGLTPTPEEVTLVSTVFFAAKVAWPEMYARLDDAHYNVWIVRSPDQRVGWREHGGIKWKDIPLFAGIPAANPANGYGGLSVDSDNSGTAYIATFIPERSPEDLLIHESTHCITRTHNDACGTHPRAFIDFERRLRDTLKNVEAL
jgi:hypothetical protein